MDNLTLFDIYNQMFDILESNERMSGVTQEKVRLLRDSREKLLSPGAMRSASSRGRVSPEPDCKVRSCFERDTGRIIYSQAFRRLKHKTQVFFNPENDHICSRLEHVMYVDYIAQTIGRALNLNTELIRAIALGHDVGHTPFGHSGERVLDKMLKETDPKLYFEHESNSLRVLDVLEQHGSTFGLNLSFEVRDGIICHCGEHYDEQVLAPCRDKTEEDISYLIRKNDRKGPATLEGCVVRFSDKFAYVGRDIEDAMRTNVLGSDYKLPDEGSEMGHSNAEMINYLVEDIIENSMDRDEIRISDRACKALKSVLITNVDTIYKSPKVKTYESYCNLVITSIYKEFLDAVYNIDRARNSKNDAIRAFASYVDGHPEKDKPESEMPLPIFVSDYIAGMTDTYAIKCFNELFKN